MRYVYDCGAMAKYAKSRDAAIDNYVSSPECGSELDVIFISHAHADHLNGFERLLSAKRKISVDTIMMPLLTVEDRLVAYSRAVAEDEKSTMNAFYRDFIVDPASALGRFQPRRIIFVRRGGSDGAPYSRGADTPPDRNDDDNMRLIDFEKVPWKFVGKGKVDCIINASTEKSSSDVLVMDDTLGLVVRLDVHLNWLLAPYVDVAVKKTSAIFVRNLAKNLSVSLAVLKKKLKDTEYIKHLVLEKTSELRNAYASIAADLNVTSMCLYSGPTSVMNALHHEYACRYGQWHSNIEDGARVAWLGTGDSALASSTRRATFLRHYNNLLNCVITLGLPHHGSDHNFHPALLKQIEPLFCVASADKYSKWRHPGTSVVQEVASAGCFVSVVTSHPASRMVESIQMS